MESIIIRVERIFIRVERTIIWCPFNVPSLYNENKSVLSLFVLNDFVKNNNQRMNKEQENAIRSLTGIVIVSGDEMTHIVPICDGYIIKSKIKQFPIDGMHITNRTND